MQGIGINVISLFGGIECGKVALERNGTYVRNYFSSEIDPYAINITQKNYPEIIHIGGVEGISFGRGILGAEDLPDGRIITAHVGTIDLLIGGSPCQDLSTAKSNGQGLSGKKSGLFYEYVRILEEVKTENPDVKFILENVASMKKADRDEITRIMGVEPILINSALVSGQNRKRLYWTNIPGVTQPEDKEIFLKDILEDIPTDDPQWKPLDEKYRQFLEGKNFGMNGKGKAFCLDANYSKVGPVNSVNGLRTTIIGQFRRTSLRIHADQEKSCTLTANMGTGGNNVPIVMGMAHRKQIENLELSERKPECNLMEKSNALNSFRNTYEITDGYYWRKLTPIECERLQTLPDNYTDCVSNSRRYKAIGNGWTVDVIAHILSFCKF